MHRSESCIVCSFLCVLILANSPMTDVCVEKKRKTSLKSDFFSQKMNVLSVQKCIQNFFAHKGTQNMQKFGSVSSIFSESKQTISKVY